MASYEKLTLDRFKGALKEGKYESLTGARRAIGKTTSWSEQERTSAQALANKHFGGAPIAAAKPATTKTAAKKTTAKPAAKTTGKKASAKKASAKGIIGAKPASTGFEHRVAAHEAIGFVSHARNELSGLKAMNVTLETSKQEKALFDILENAINHMAQTLPKADAQVVTAVPKIEVPKTEAAVAPKRVVHNVADDVHAQASATVGEVQQNGTIEESDLTEAERSARDLLQGAPDLGLPRPSQI